MTLSTARLRTRPGAPFSANAPGAAVLLPTMDEGATTRAHRLGHTGLEDIRIAQDERLGPSVYFKTLS